MKQRGIDQKGIEFHHPRTHHAPLTDDTREEIGTSTKRRHQLSLHAEGITMTASRQEEGITMTEERHEMTTRQGVKEAMMIVLQGAAATTMTAHHGAIMKIAHQGVQATMMTALR